MPNQIHSMRLMMLAALALLPSVGCMAGPWVELKATKPAQNEITATVQTGTHVMNDIEGDSSNDEHWYAVTYRIDHDANRTTLAVAPGRVWMRWPLWPAFDVPLEPPPATSSNP